MSLESTNFPGYFLRNRNYEVWVERNDGSAQFRADASFQRRAGLADAAGLSLEAANFAGRYVRHRGGLLYVETVPAAEGSTATFALE